MMKSEKKVYLDYAATTPLDLRVMEVMSPYFSHIYGNPSSVHTFGQQAEAAIEKSREMVSEYLNCHPHEIVFTSCGSESDNLALRGTAMAAKLNRNANHILISPVEHHAVKNTAKQLNEIYGFELEYVPVDEFGQVDPENVSRHIRDDTAVVSMIHANNEIGSINPIAEIGEICRKRNIPFHTDAVQAAAYLPLDVDKLRVDLLAIGAHKFYGPKGVGALYVRKGTPILPSQTGGSQEFGIRAGTSNVPYIVGLAEAFRLSNLERNNRRANLMALRDRIIGFVLEEIPDAKLTGHPVERLPNHASFVFRGLDGNALLTILDVRGYACSSGSACKTGDPEPSDVLTSVGFDRDWALGSLRVTLGTHTTAKEIETFLFALPGIIQQARSLASVTS